MARILLAIALVLDVLFFSAIWYCVHMMIIDNPYWVFVIVGLFLPFCMLCLLIGHFMADRNKY